MTLCNSVYLKKIVHYSLAIITDQVFLDDISSLNETQGRYDTAYASDGTGQQPEERAATMVTIDAVPDRLVIEQVAQEEQPGGSVIHTQTVLI